ncbi:hypothetical protein [Sphingomonas arenae]|uniref:hypothetical protein n=1 Tax=Sphingomonas arenae TaxID=2812555 RepID=UPI001F2B26CF|nr:hypothetical protein [Sphingomonas arenae]
MTEEMSTQSRTPVHLWIVGAVSLLWNAFGGYDYLMTRQRNREYLSQMGINPDELLAYIDGFPIWAQIAWGLGVWGAVAGSVLLLLRSRWAVLAFGLSLIGALVSFAYQFAGPPAPAGMDEGAAAWIPLVIVGIAAALFFYARRQQASGVLR